MALKKCIYDFQATNRKPGGLSARTPFPLAHSYWSPGSHICKPHGWLENTKTPPQQSGYTYFLIEKLLNTTFLLLKPFTRYNSNIFCEEQI
jgi:hypothetical protein